MESAYPQNGETTLDEEPRKQHVCPWWVGYLLASPLRKRKENPDEILADILEPGMTVTDIGSAMGFFSLPAARLVGENGRVVCLDVQDRILRTLTRRAGRKGLSGTIETRLCSQEDLGLQDLVSQVDVALAIHVVHETTYPARWFRQVRDALKPGGKLIVAEPLGHVSEADFEREKAMASCCGFSIHDCRGFNKSRAMICVKEATED